MFNKLMKNILWWLEHLIKRIQYFIKHGRDDYGKLGFNQLYYRGIPIITRGWMPKDIVWVTNLPIEEIPMSLFKKKGRSKRMNGLVTKIKV